MSKVLVFLADGFEEIEAVTIIDVLRRAGVEVTSASLGNPTVRGAHDLLLIADCRLDDISTETFDAILLPGGTPGSYKLRDDPENFNPPKAARKG